MEVAKLSKWSEYTDRLIRILRIKASPVAVKIFRKGEVLPTDVRRPSEPLTFCQFTYLSRVHKEILLGTFSDIVCAYAQSFLGFADFPEDLYEGKRAAGRRTETAEAYKRLLSDMARIEPGTTEAVLTSPLEATPVDPDVILLYVTPGQTTQLLHAATWKTGERIVVRTAAEAGTCGEAVAATYLSRRPTIAFPCSGTRRFGQVEDDELIFAIPAFMMNEFMGWLEAIHRHLPYPVKRQVEFTPRPPLLYYIRREPMDKVEHSIPPEQKR